MQRHLYARECGEKSRGLARIFSAPWTHLGMDLSREYDVSYCELPRFVDIDRPSGTLILCGGATNAAYGDPYSAALGVFRCVEKGQRAEQDHLSRYIHVREAPIEFNCGRWHPETLASFVTGSSDFAEVLVWDTERFSPVTSFDLDDDDAVMTVEMSCAPGAKSNLVALGTFHCKYVRLVPMETGTAVHKMRMPISGVAGVNDVSWSPVKPHMLACVDTEGFLYLFDIRKSGVSSCILQFDESRRMPIFDQRKAERIRTCRDVVQNKARNSYRIERPHFLGLGCAWDDKLFYCLNGMDAFSGRIAMENRDKVPQMGRVHFTPDGSSVVTVDVNGLIRVWDVFTGHLIRTYYNAASVEDKSDGFYGFSTPFVVSPDGSHILCTPHKGDRRGSLLTVDMEGCEISCAEGPPTLSDITGMQDITVHPLREEVYSIPCDFPNSKITCWSPKTKDEREKVEFN